MRRAFTAVKWTGSPGFGVILVSVSKISRQKGIMAPYCSWPLGYGWETAKEGLFKEEEEDQGLREERGKKFSLRASFWVHAENQHSLEATCFGFVRTEIWTESKNFSWTWKWPWSRLPPPSPHFHSLPLESRSPPLIPAYLQIGTQRENDNNHVGMVPI